MYCHNKKILHGGLRPESILFESKNSIIIKITDFGSNQINDRKSLINMKESPYYTAPECISGVNNKRSDVWSVGVIVYILLCGQPPFSGYDNEVILQAIKRKELEFPEDKWGDISDEAVSLLKQMLEKDP